MNIDDEKELYCEKCGSKMERVIEFSDFDRFSGMKRYEERYRCPNKSWWNEHDDWIYGWFNSKQ